jgi:hypothetical protein
MNSPTQNTSTEIIPAETANATPAANVESAAPATPKSAAKSSASAASKPPAEVDAIIQKFLNRADEYADQEEVEPKVLCALGWLVVKMKAAQTKAAATGQPFSKCVTEETLNEVERRGQIE